MKLNILIFIYCLFLISKINAISKKSSLRKIKTFSFNKKEPNKNSFNETKKKIVENIVNYIIDIKDASINQLKQKEAQFELKKEQKQIVLKKADKIINKLKKLSKENSLTSKKIENAVKEALEQLPQEISQKILGNEQNSQQINSQQVKNLINKIQKAQQQVNQQNIF